MQSQTTEAYRKLLALAPAAIQAKARSAYGVWVKNPAHPSLRFKKVHNSLPVYSVRIGSLADDGLGVGTRMEKERLVFSYPIALLASHKPPRPAG